MDTGILRFTGRALPPVVEPGNNRHPDAGDTVAVRIADGAQALLIVDDSERLDEVASLLTASGIAVTCLSDPYGAERGARPVHPFAAILLDVLLPTRDLYRLCRQLRSSGPVPLIVASWEDRTDLEAGPQDRIVPHSCSATELASTVLAVVGNVPRTIRIRD